MTDIIEECARASFDRDTTASRRGVGPDGPWHPTRWDDLTPVEKRPFIADMQAAINILRTHGMIHEDGLAKIKAAEERRK